MTSTIRARHHHHPPSDDGNENDTAETAPAMEKRSASMEMTAQQQQPPPPENEEEDEKLKLRQRQERRTKIVISTILILLLGFVVFDSVSKGDLVLSCIKRFLNWVELHPIWGMFAYIVVYTVAIALLIPGTPLTLGGAFVFSQSFGLSGGIPLATLAVFIGESCGSVVAFFLGRYLLQNWVKTLIKKYPLFEAIDTALSDNGFRIMSFLHLTPIIPFGPISYMSGTTSISFVAFTASNIACIPLNLLYIFIGASAGDLVTSKEDGRVSKTILLVIGISLSFVSIGLISFYVRKELRKIIEKQDMEKKSSNDIDAIKDEEEGNVICTV